MAKETRILLTEMDTTDSDTVAPESYGGLPGGFGFANWFGSDGDGNLWQGSGLVYEGVVYNGTVFITKGSDSPNEFNTTQWTLYEGSIWSSLVLPIGSLATQQRFSSFDDGVDVPGDGSGAVALPWGGPEGDDLLDLTTPTEPIVLSDGVYTWTVVVLYNDVPVLGNAMVTLTLDSTGSAFTVQETLPLNFTGFNGDNSTAIVITTKFKMVAGMTVTLTVSQGSGSDHPFSIPSALVVKD